MKKMNKADSLTKQQIKIAETYLSTNISFRKLAVCYDCSPTKIRTIVNRYKQEVANVKPTYKTESIPDPKPMPKTEPFAKIGPTLTNKITLWLVDYDSTDISALAGIDRLPADDMVCIYCSKLSVESLPELKKIANTKASVSIYITGTANTSSALEISSRLSSDIFTKHESKYHYHIVTNNKSYNSLINVLRQNSNIDINLVQNLNGTQISEINT
ncbi:MAG: hypothetical protein K6C13_15525 [Oscillospiraceae bacterium]|nr:hypothetical protein [Oscillospiraceae bacterium]